MNAPSNDSCSQHGPTRCFFSSDGLAGISACPVTWYLQGLAPSKSVKFSDDQPSENVLQFSCGKAAACSLTPAEMLAQFARDLLFRAVPPPWCLDLLLKGFCIFPPHLTVVHWGCILGDPILILACGSHLCRLVPEGDACSRASHPVQVFNITLQSKICHQPRQAWSSLQSMHQQDSLPYSTVHSRVAHSQLQSSLPSSRQSSKREMSLTPVIIAP